MARRKTPTKQMFTPRQTATSARKTMNNNLNNTTKKRLNFPPTNTSTAKKKGNPFRQPLSMMGPPGDVPGLIQCRRPTEMDFSLNAGNIANSTFINPVVQTGLLEQTQGSYSPVIRRCISEIGSTLDEKINAAVSELANKINGSVLMGGGGAGKRITMSVGLEEMEPPKRRRTRNSHLQVRIWDNLSGCLKIIHLML